MKKFVFLMLGLCLVCENALADGSYECDIEKLDAGKTMAIVYVNNCQQVSGSAEAFSQGNGLSNDPTGSQSYLWLARDANEVAETKHQLSMVLAALAAQKRMVFRFSQDGDRAVINYLLIK